jgi:hypothetical protein
MRIDLELHEDGLCVVYTNFPHEPQSPSACLWLIPRS